MRDRFRFPYGWALAFTVALFASCSIAVSRAGGQTPDTTHTVRTPIRIAEVRDSLLKADSLRHATDSSRASVYAAADSALKAATVLRQRADSLLGMIHDTTVAVPVFPRLHSRYGQRRATAVYAAGILLGAGINYVGRIDVDTGGYRDSWKTPDKFYHADVAYFLTTGALNQSVPPAWAFALTCGVAGPAWEVSQRGFISGKDIVADCVGSALAIGMHHLARKAADALR